MSDEKALLATITANPLDDAPRLVYADWLDEQGGKANVARAEFIRVQCEMELLGCDDPQYGKLEKRQKALLKEWKKTWVKPLKKAQRSAPFVRGFPTPDIRTHLVEQMVKLTEADLQHAPQWRFPAEIADDEFDLLLRWPLLPRICTIHFGANFKPQWPKRLAECDGLRNVTELTFTGSDLTVRHLRVILDAWIGRRLTQLWVNQIAIGDAGIRLIATHPATTNLRLLYAHSAGITSRGMKAVADGPNLDRLRFATFAHNKIGATGGRHLLKWKALPGIRELYLMNTGFTDPVKREFRKRLGKRVELT